MTQFYLNTEPVVTRVGVLDDASDAEFTREEWLAWYESEFAGYQVERDEQLVEDNAGEREMREALFAAGLSREEVDDLCPGPVQVPAHLLQLDRETTDWLRRSGGNRKVRYRNEQGRWVTKNLVGTRRNHEMLREGPDGSAVVRGAHPFSKQEGAAEWLGRARSELREVWRLARTDAARSAVVAREAALRARHNARAYARQFAAYHRLDEAQTLSMLDGWQKQNPIGWLGLESAMRHLFEGCFEHYEEARRDWEVEFDSLGSWLNDGVPTREEKDEWVDRMPTPPEYPTNLVTSVKRVRKHSSVPSGNTLPRPQTKTARKAKEVVERKHAFRQASSEHRSKLQRDRERHARIAAVVSGATVPEPLAEDRVAEWFDLRKEWERAEMIETERLSVPESLPMPNVQGDLERDFERLQKRLAQYEVEREERSKNATRYLSTAA